MNRFNLINAGRDIIAKGCGCDRFCKSKNSDGACGCRLDAEQIVMLTLGQAASLLDEPAANIVRGFM